MRISGHEGVRDEVRMRGREEQGEEKKHPQSVTSYNIVINQRVIERAKNLQVTNLTQYLDIYVRTTQVLWDTIFDD